MVALGNRKCPTRVKKGVTSVWVRGLASMLCSATKCFRLSTAVRFQSSSSCGLTKACVSAPWALLAFRTEHPFSPLTSTVQLSCKADSVIHSVNNGNDASRFPTFGIRLGWAARHPAGPSRSNVRAGRPACYTFSYRHIFRIASRDKCNSASYSMPGA
jgi:hypothetical protein